MNVLDKLPRTRQAEARSLLTKIPYAATREDAERQKQVFQAWCAKRGLAEVGRRLDRDWERMVTFYHFPREHWKHLRTTDENVKWRVTASGNRLGVGTGGPDRSVGHEAASSTG